MTQAMLTIGSGRAAKLGVGNKAALLDKAARRSLPVPAGMILLDEAYYEALEAGLIHVEADRVTADDYAALVSWLALPRYPGLVAVRSAFSTEDRGDEALAGYFTSHLRVDPTDPTALANALLDVWSSALRYEGHFRRDVLIMGMVLAEVAGVAFTERAYEDDLINYTGGTAEDLLSGAEPGESLLLAKLRRWEHRSELTPDAPFTWRLQVLLREVRAVFGEGDWDIEWADDGAHTWLVQIRPVTRPTRRDEAFTIANHKEILPELPSPFMTSTIASCAADLFAFYRSFDSALPADRPFIEVFYGRPFINLSLLTEMMRSWGLPTDVVTSSIGGETDRPAGLNLGRAVRKAPTLIRQGLAQLRSAGSAKRTEEDILAETARLPGNFAGNIAVLRWLYTTLVTEMFSLTAAIGPPLLVLRRLGVLEALSARQQTISTQLYTDLDPLRGLVAQRPDLDQTLAAGHLPDDPEFGQLWAAYIKKHGHRGIYESDISRPRFHEAPASLLQMLRTAPLTRSERRKVGPLARLVSPLWWQAARAIQAREHLRYTAMRGFDRIRQALLALAERATERGQLPEPGALWLLTVEEAAALDEGWAPGEAFFTERQAELDELAAYHLPDLFHRFDDLEMYREGAAPNGDGQQRLRGVSLTTGDVRGRAWVLREPGEALPQGFRPEQTILVARSVDAGWIPTFSQVAGVVVETGGDLSHGSIILREIGLPAVTNVSGATRTFSTGESLQLKASQGVVERVAG